MCYKSRIQTFSPTKNPLTLHPLPTASSSPHAHDFTKPVTRKLKRRTIQSRTICSLTQLTRRARAKRKLDMPTDRAEPNDDCNLFVGSVDSGDRYRSRGRAAGVSEDRAHVAAGTERQAGSGRCCCGC